jgi:aminoglycoside phosphotransferase (APT) family kinase protein
MPDATEAGAAPAWHPPAEPPAAVLRSIRDPVVARLHTGVRSRIWRVEGSGTTAVIVKLCRDRGAAEREYALLRLFHERYGADEGVRVPRPIALFAEEHALVAEHLRFVTLRSLGSVQGFVRSAGRSRVRFLTLLDAAGRWLGQLHGDRAMARSLQRLAAPEPRSAAPIGGLLDAAAEGGLPAALAREAESLLAGADEPGRHCATHGDFGMANIAAAGDALVVIDLADAAVDVGTHEVARTWTRLLGVPGLALGGGLGQARGRFLHAYGGRPAHGEWQRWRVWALLELFGESRPGGWKRTLWSRVIRRRCLRELREVLGDG